MAAHEQTKGTNNIKAKINKTWESSKCRMGGWKSWRQCKSCVKRMQQVSLQKYKKWHHWSRTKIHWVICRKYAAEMKEKWYEHKPEVVMGNNE